MPTHSALFVALGCLMLSALSGLTSRARIQNKIFVGDGGNRDIQRRSRAHGVSVEHLLPLLLLLLTLELCGASKWVVDLFGIAILGARVVHVTGFIGGNQRVRLLGMMGTYTTEVALGVSLLLRLATL